MYFWLHWVLVALCGLLELQRAGPTLLQCASSPCGGFSRGAQALGTWVSVVAYMGSVVVANRLSCSAACEILDQG